MRASGKIPRRSNNDRKRILRMFDSEVGVEREAEGDEFWDDEDREKKSGGGVRGGDVMRERGSREWDGLKPCDDHGKLFED